KAKLIAFDKTGTITNGQLMVANIVPNTGVSKEELLQIAASSEQESTHILARSLVDYAKQEGIDLLPLTSSKELTAMGVESQIEGHLIRAGKASLMSDLSSDLQAHETAIYVSKDDHYLGYIGFKDTIRPESKETIERLKNYGI
ncbi:HAD family hydrolase, partial [Streptococcus suis]